MTIVNVEHRAPVSVLVDTDSGEVLRVIVHDSEAQPTGKLLDEAGHDIVPAVVPPKFTSPEEADEWLENRPPVPEGATVMEQADIEVATKVASDGTEWPSWEFG